MRILARRFLLASLVLATVVGSARAGIVTTQMDTSTPVFTFDVPSQGVVNEGGYVGPNTIRFDSSGPVQAYCTDLFRTIGGNDSYASSLQPLSALTDGGLVAKLFTADRLSGNSGGAVNQAALQLAIWDVVESGRAGVSPFVPDSSQVVGNRYQVPGLFSLSTNQVSLQDTLGRVSYLLTTAQYESGASDQITYIAPDGPHGQGFVTAESFTGPSISQAVPEPSTLILTGIALVGFLGRRFLKRQFC